MIGIRLCLVIGLVKIVLAEGDTIINISNSKECTEPIKKNAPIAFSVGIDKDFMATGTDTIPMNHEFYNEGKYYDIKTHRFIAPVSGVYSFFFGGASDAGKMVHMYLFVGDEGKEEKIAATYNTDKVNYGFASGFVYKKLKKGQMASVRLHPGYSVDGYKEPSTYFSGALFQETDN